MLDDIITEGSKNSVSLPSFLLYKLKKYLSNAFEKYAITRVNGLFAKTKDSSTY